MSLVVGVNAYADVNEYDELISSRFMSKNPIRKYWDDLDNGDKECLIVGSTLRLDNDAMLYKGYKQNINQPLQFPRIIRNGEVEQVNDNIKLGIILQGCRDAMLEGTTEGEMIANGVKSFADGTGARIEFGDTSNNSSSVRLSNGINKDIWVQYFSQYSLMV